MKKFLLCMLLAGLMMPIVAQEKKSSFFKMEEVVLQRDETSDLGLSTQPVLPVNPVATMVEIDGWTIAGTSNSYDRQTQNAVYPMTKRHSDGFIGCTWTTDDNSAFPGSSTPNRGIGYSYSMDNGATWSAQENRVGGIPLYWPSYAPWGENGEAILGRSADTYMHQGVQILNGLVLLTRENKGQGEWTITPVPYPTATSPADGYTMAWARMTTSGNNHQYIHIMSPMGMPTGQTYNGYYDPVFYYRTQNGGATWDVSGSLVPEMVGQQWDVHSHYIDAITFADTDGGDMVACAFIRLGSDGYVLRSYNNGNAWESIKFFDTPVSYYTPPSQYADTCYIPTQGCIALDNDGKIHVAFSVRLAKNHQDAGVVNLFKHFAASFLSYWNEYMPPIDGGVEYVYNKIEPIIDDYFDWDLSDEYRWYVKHSIPGLPIIGFFTPTYDYNYFIMPDDSDWVQNSYGKAGAFSFPQMIFDRDNVLHLFYLGIVDGGEQDGRWLRHPYYTSTNGGGKWTQTQYLVNTIDLIDREFAYLTLSGIDDNPDQQVHLMAQIDPYAGTYITSNPTPDHPATTNYFYHFNMHGEYIEPCYPVTNFAVNYTEDCKAELTWNAPGSNQFKIYRDNTPYPIATVEDETSYTDEDFDVLSGHIWKVAAICGSDESHPASVTKPACAPCDPVTGAKATIDNCTTATITWNDIAGAIEYKVLRNGEVLDTVTVPEFIETDEFENGKTYTWNIITVCKYGESASAVASIKANCVSINELANSVSIYPNPTTGMITVDAAGFVKVEIYNPVGQLIETKTVKTFDVSTYNTGIYFFKVYDDNNNNVTKRVMIAK